MQPDHLLTYDGQQEDQAGNNRIDTASGREITAVISSRTLPEERADMAAGYLLECQHEAGFWVFDLEADSTIPAEYLLLQRFLGLADPSMESRLVRYLYKKQLPDGGWPLYHKGSSDISASVKAYFALKLAGEPPESENMTKARRKIQEMGGAERVNVFTRITLALFGQIPWRTVPAMPVEIMLLPRWFFFHLHKISYWSRCVMVPLLILFAKRPVCQLPKDADIRELFLAPPEKIKHIDRAIPGKMRRNLFIFLDRVLKRAEPMIPGGMRRKALEKAEAWTRERMKGEGGPGGIFPAMANSLMALQVLGAGYDDPDFSRCHQAVEDLITQSEGETFCQPCLSPIWDTCLTLNSLLAYGYSAGHPAVDSAEDWLLNNQIFTRGDWSLLAPDLEPGGWAFQFENSLYPDLDDTAMVLTALLRVEREGNGHRQEQISRAVRWLLGMQNRDGGWGAFDIDNRHLYLNDIPFADHGALLDPSTVDVTARCVETLAMLGHDRSYPPIARALKFLRREQETSGAWYGRWGVNYIYGTWSVLAALNMLGEDPSQPYIQRAINWMVSCQNSDGGWGESCASYDDPSRGGQGGSTASQTAWALLGLMAAGQGESRSVQQGIQYLLKRQSSRGDWEEDPYTGTGFPRVFYLRYHGYRRYFPLWALGIYNRLTAGESPRKAFLTGITPFSHPDLIRG
jgi:squalene-hopene/tetraprenyl-beta-curcumene cyclase